VSRPRSFRNCRATGEGRIRIIELHKMFCLKNLKGRDHLEETGLDEKIILEWILGK
jgi:hypothetical protein